MSESVRTFIAVELSPQARTYLAQAVQSMKEQGLQGVRWVRPEGIHLTLKFLGGIPLPMVEKVAQALKEACRGISPFELALSKTGAFPNVERPRVLWIGLSGDLDPLAELQKRIESRMQRLGFPPETRGFSPHVTLGRVRDNTRTPERRRIGEVFGKVQAEDVPSWSVETVNLMKSTLMPSGAIYTALAKISLA
jgi:2'-5' RNA ligase